MERKEAIEVVKNNLPDNCFTMLCEALETLIPELRESEDEVIRKWLINEIKIKHHNLDENNVEFVDKAIAWLEKQGKKINPYRGVSFEYNGHTWGMCARDNGVDISLDGQLFTHLEEYCRPQHTNSKEDIERLRDATISFLKVYAEQGYENAVECIDWLKNLI